MEPANKDFFLTPNHHQPPAIQQYSSLTTNQHQPLATASQPRIWKLKIPLKIKNFLWFLKRGVTLTKNNLTKRNWQGNQQCCFCHEYETIQYLFFDCRMARLAWATVYAAWGIPKPRSFANMFGNWLKGITKNLKQLVLVGAAALCCHVQFY